MTTTYTDEQIDRAAKAISDVIGHGMREKCIEMAKVCLSTLTPSSLGSGDAVDAARYRWIRLCNLEQERLIRAGDELHTGHILDAIIDGQLAIDAALAKGNEHE
jgi:hypothetical protein